MSLESSGSSSSRSSGPGSSSSRASTSASAPCTSSSAAPTSSGGSPSTPSGRSGTATRCGSSSGERRSSPPSPSWYATWFSAGYLALFLVLVALIIRGVSFEWRAKVDTDRWRGTWSWTLTVGSVLIPLLLGVALGDLLAGLPINSSARVHRIVLGPAHALRPVARSHPCPALPAARRHVPCAEDRRTGPAAGPGPRRQAGLAVGRPGRRLRGLDGGDLRRRRLAHRRRGRTRRRRARSGAAHPLRSRGPVVRSHRGQPSAAPSPPLFANLYPNVMVSSTSTCQQPHRCGHCVRRLRPEGHDGRRPRHDPVVLLYQGWSYWVFRARVSAPPLPTYGAKVETS